MTENKTSQSSTISCVSTILSSDRCSSLIHKSFAVVTMGVKTANCHPGHMRITELFQQSCEQLHHKLLTMGDVLFAVLGQFYASFECPRQHMFFLLILLLFYQSNVYCLLERNWSEEAKNYQLCSYENLS